MAVKLDQQQLLDIAMEVQRNPSKERALTNYLTEEEKEAVKEILKNLRASALAMKTYVQKTVYLDSLKRTQEAWMKASARVMTEGQMANRAKADYRAFMSIKKRVMSNLLRLDKEQLLEAELLNKVIAECQLNIYRKFDEAGISPATDPKTLHAYEEGQMLAEMNVFLFSQGLGKPQDAKDLENVVKNMKQWSRELNERVPGFAKSTDTWATLMDAAMDELRINYGIPSAMALGRLESRIKRQRRTVDFLNQQSVRQIKLAGKASEQLQVEKKKTIAMANWYLVAAMGDALVELGQSLAY